MTPAIETTGLTKRYGRSTHGITDLTLTVQQGEVFGFLGPNGAGKTTTIRTLLGLLKPTAGHATVLGLDVQRDGRAIRARMGNLPGDFAYEPRMTGRRLLQELAALRGRRDLGIAHDLAARFRADLDRPLRELSRGNRQKVGLIQALFHEPELLILDEPTGGLDPLMQEQFLAVVGEQRDRGATVFLSSHDLDEVERVCDRVGIVRDAQLVAVERIEDMRGHAARDVVARFAAPVPAGAFASLEGRKRSARGRDRGAPASGRRGRRRGQSARSARARRPRGDPAVARGAVPRLLRGGRVMPSTWRSLVAVVAPGCAPSGAHR